MFPIAELLASTSSSPTFLICSKIASMCAASCLRTVTKTNIGRPALDSQRLNVPVWATEFTLAYVEDKLDEHQLLDDATCAKFVPENASRLGLSRFIRCK